MAFAGERVTVANTRLNTMWPVDFGELVEWSDPPMEGRNFVCQRPSAVPVSVKAFGLEPATPIAAADGRGRLIGVTFSDPTQARADGTGEPPEDIRPTSLPPGRPLSGVIEPLQSAAYLGTRTESGTSELYYFAAARVVVVASCRTYPDAFGDADRRAGRTRLCEVIWHQDAEPQPRTVKMVATVSVRPGREPAVVQAVVDGWPALFAGVRVAPLEG